MRCFNCNERNHFTFQCPLSKCLQCGKQFESPRERYNHGKTTHAPNNNKSNYNNNNNNNFMSNNINIPQHNNINNTKQQQAILDSGTQTILVSDSTAKSMNYITYTPQINTKIQYPNGYSDTCSKMTTLHDYNIHVLPTLNESLIGISPLVDNGNTIKFNNHFVSIYNENNNETYQFDRHSDGMWRIPLQFLEKLSTTSSPPIFLLSSPTNQNKDQVIKALSAKLYIPNSVRNNII